jgi:hypothetical protein
VELAEAHAVLANALPLLMPEVGEVVVEEAGVNTILFDFNDDDASDVSDEQRALLVIRFKHIYNF